MDIAMFVAFFSNKTVFFHFPNVSDRIVWSCVVYV
jgi:hypothetical protein